MLLYGTMELRQDVLDYYLDNFDKLSSDKQFHFATRIAAWNGDARCLAHLKNMQTSLIPTPINSENSKAMLQELITNPPAAHINAAAVREPYFIRYPQLRGIDFALFRVRHAWEVYGMDIREQLLEIVSRKELRSLEKALLADTEAVRILSTYAINYVYLLHKMLFEDDSLDRSYFLQLGTSYEATEVSQLQLLIYLYTHCIIGETNFYVQTIPAAHLPIYRKMLEQLESLIAKDFERINLDNKLEFLVCCRICDYKTELQQRIDDECVRSISTEGTFVVDRHNSNVQASKMSFDASEHRNVLFIMSGTAYMPHSTRV